MLSKSQINELVKLVERLTPAAVNELKPFLDVEAINMKAIANTMRRYTPEKVDQLEQVRTGSLDITPSATPAGRRERDLEDEERKEFEAPRSNQP